MIAKVGKRGDRLWGLVDYLFGIGDHDEHINQRYIATFDGRVEKWNARNHDDLRKVMDDPVKNMVRAGNAPEGFKHVWHCSISAHADDGKLTDEQWAEIGRGVAEEVGLIENNCRWAVVNHGKNKSGNDHVHLYAVMINDETLQPYHPKFDKKKSAKKARSYERKFGLTETGKRNGTGGKGLSQGEIKKAERLGVEPVKVFLHRNVRDAKNRSHNLEEFESYLNERGVEVAYRYSKKNESQVTGVKFRSVDDVDGLFFGGSKLASDLSWPRLKPLLTHKRVKPVNDVSDSLERLDSLTSEAVKVLGERCGGDLVEASEVLLQTLADLSGDKRLKESVKKFERVVPEPHKKTAETTFLGGSIRDIAIVLAVSGSRNDTLRMAVAVWYLIDSIQTLRRRQGEIKQATEALKVRNELAEYVTNHPDKNTSKPARELAAKIGAPTQKQEPETAEYKHRRKPKQSETKNLGLS